MMSMNSLPYEKLHFAFLTNIILLENISDDVLEAAANNLNHLWYSKRTRGVEDNEIAGIEAYYENHFDRFLHIHKLLEKRHSIVLFGSIMHGTTFFKCTKVSMKST